MTEQAVMTQENRASRQQLTTRQAQSLRLENFPSASISINLSFTFPGADPVESRKVVESPCYMGTVQNRLGAYVESGGRNQDQIIQGHLQNNFARPAAYYGLQFICKEIKNRCPLPSTPTVLGKFLERMQRVSKGGVLSPSCNSHPSTTFPSTELGPCVSISDEHPQNRTAQPRLLERH